MDLEFKTQQELYKRVKPALEAKRIELERLGISKITREDIWSYLKEVKWQNSENLMLSDVVSDILHLDNKRISSYMRKKKTRRGRSEENEKRRDKKEEK